LAGDDDDDTNGGVGSKDRRAAAAAAATTTAGTAGDGRNSVKMERPPADEAEAAALQDAAAVKTGQGRDASFFVGKMKRPPAGSLPGAHDDAAAASPPPAHGAGKLPPLRPLRSHTLATAVADAGKPDLAGNHAASATAEASEEVSTKDGALAALIAAAATGRGAGNPPRDVAGAGPGSAASTRASGIRLAPAKHAPLAAAPRAAAAHQGEAVSDALIAEEHEDATHYT
jgi:hypothetical protein